MPKAIQDRDTIASSALGIASAEEREAFIAQVCGDDTELRRQVEERVAAHFQASSQAQAALTVDTARPNPVQAGGKQADGREPEPSGRNPSRALAAFAVMLLLLYAVAATALVVWELRKEEQARNMEQEAIQKQEKAEKAAAEYQGFLREAVEARKDAVKALDHAKEAEKAALRSQEDTKAVLVFLKDKLLSAGRPAGVSLTEAFWAGGQGKNVTLRQAVDTAESQVAAAFADRPLNEASIREILGWAYLNLGEAARAVPQYERAFALWEALLGVNHPETAACRNQLAVAYRLAGRAVEGARLFDRDLNSPAHAAALAVQGSMLLRKKPYEAELKLRECLTMRQKIQPDDWTTFDTKSLLGEALLEQKKLGDAEPLLVSGYEGMKQHADAIPSQDKLHLTKALERLITLYETWGKEDQAFRWRQEREAAGAVPR